MATTPRQRLREFYDQAMLSPELLCLNCSHTAWNRAGCKCSERRQQDCALFVNDMVNRLGQTQAGQEGDADTRVSVSP